MSHVHFTTLKHGEGPLTRQPEVIIKHQGSGSQKVKTRGSGPTNTPYKYKIITEEDKEEDKEIETEEIDRKLSAPSKAYLPPAPVPTYLPPSARVEPPSAGYLPPSPQLSAPHRSYLPPEPSGASPPHSPTLANLNEVHTLPSLDKLQHHKSAHVIFPPTENVKPQPIFEPSQHQPKAFIGPQLPSAQPKNSQYSVSVSEERIKPYEYSNKGKLQEALKKFNAKPNIDRESSSANSSDDVELVPQLDEKLKNDPKLSDLKITSTSSAVIESSTTTTSTTQAPTTTTTTASTTILSKLKLDAFLPQLDTNEEIVLDGRDGAKDDFVFGPQTRPTSSTGTPSSPSPRLVSSTVNSLLFTTARPDISPNDPVNDIVLGL